MSLDIHKGEVWVVEYLKAIDGKAVPQVETETIEKVQKSQVHGGSGTRYARESGQRMSRLASGRYTSFSPSAFAPKLVRRATYDDDIKYPRRKEK